MCKNIFRLSLLVLFVNIAIRSDAQNPLIRDQFTADPSARVFGDRVYVYPSHDILATEGRGRVGWFCMEDYHVFSSANLTDWTDHGMIVHQHKVPWVKPGSYSMWAPDCIYRNGKYYFYFPSTPVDTSYTRGFTIGVAIADKPEGPFIPQPVPIKNVRGIDPNVFIDKDGQAYLFWSEGNIYGAKLKDNMVELASDPVVLQHLPEKGLKEGPWLFERNGIYYLTYPHVEKKIERLEYATGDNPLGPFKITGVIMDESPAGCWTNHHSIMHFKDQWYLFYHHNDYSPTFDKARSIRADSLFFNADGTIQKVNPTFRGIGVTKANTQIQIDRYSRIGEKDITVAFLDTANKFQGWKLVFDAAGAWVQYNSVDFGKKKFKTVTLRAQSQAGGTLQIRIHNIQGPVLAEVPVTAGKEWQLIKMPLVKFEPGIQNLFIVSRDTNRIEVDWIGFE
jgi:hypothetical protein